MEIDKHSTIVDSSEKHLPKGFESPSKGSLLAGAMPNVEKTNNAEVDGSVLVGRTAENTGMKWIQNFLLLVIGTLTKFVFKDISSGDELFLIEYDSSTEKAKIGTASGTAGKVSLIADGIEVIILNESGSGVGIKKESDTNVSLDVKGKVRQQNNSSKDSQGGFTDRFISNKYASNSTAFIDIFKISTNGESDFASGFVEITTSYKTPADNFGISKHIFAIGSSGTLLSAVPTLIYSSDDYCTPVATVLGSDITFAVNAPTAGASTANIVTLVEATLSYPDDALAWSITEL